MRFAQEISIFNPYAIEKQIIALGTSITQTAREIELRADSTYAEKGVVTEMQSRLTIMADSISSEVTARQNADSAMSSRIDQTAQAISSEVTNRHTAESAMSSRIDQTADKISQEVTDRRNADTSLSSKINQTPHTIKLSVSSTKASKTTGPSITLTVKDANGNTLSTDSGTIRIDGNVVFTNDLSTAGSTTIDGGNITTGTMSAARIKGGTLKLGGASNGNGQMQVFDANNNEIGHWNNSGVYIKDGEIYQEKYEDPEAKYGWLRIQGTEITGGYTGFNHTAIVDLQDWEWAVDTGTGQRRKEGVLSLRCTNGSIHIKPDNGVYIEGKKEVNMLSHTGAVVGYFDDSSERVDSYVAALPEGLYIRSSDSMRINGYYTSTAYGTAFAPRGDGVRRVCDIVNGLICNLRTV